MVNYAVYNNRYKSLGFMLCCDDTERVKKLDSIK